MDLVIASNRTYFGLNLLDLRIEFWSASIPRDGRFPEGHTLSTVVDMMGSCPKRRLRSARGIYCVIREVLMLTVTSRRSLFCFVRRLTCESVCRSLQLWAALSLGHGLVMVG